jgi:hypothetical protein
MIKYLLKSFLTQINYSQAPGNNLFDKRDSRLDVIQPVTPANDLLPVIDYIS